MDPTLHACRVCLDCRILSQAAAGFAVTADNTLSQFDIFAYSNTSAAMVSNTSSGDAAAPKAGNQPLSGSMNPGPVIDSSNTKQGSDPTASSGYPIPKLVQPERAVEGTNREIDHGAELTKETGKAFTEGKVHGEAQGEKHLDSDLEKQSAPSGAAKLKEVSFVCKLHARACKHARWSTPKSSGHY